MDYQKPKLIAEIGCNHKGDIAVAKQLVKIAAQSSVDVVKFQKRNNKELLTKNNIVLRTLIQCILMGKLMVLIEIF